MLESRSFFNWWPSSDYFKEVNVLTLLVTGLLIENPVSPVSCKCIFSKIFSKSIFQYPKIDSLKILNWKLSRAFTILRVRNIQIRSLRFCEL